MSSSTTLTAHRTVDNQVQERYGFHFIHEFHGHVYPVKCAVVREVVINVKKDQEEQNADSANPPQQPIDTQTVPIGSEISNNRLVDEDLERRIGYQILSVDGRSVRMWENYGERKRILFPSGKTNFLRTLCFVEQKSVYVAASSDLCMKFFNLNLENVGSVKLGQRAVYEVCYNSRTEQLVTAGVDGVTLWNWFEQKTQEWDKRYKLWRSVKKYNLTQDRILEQSQWASGLQLDIINNRLHVLCESNVMVYDARSGCRIDTLLNVHDHLVTDCLFYANNHYYVTSSMGGEIKIWSKSRNNSLVHKFQNHSKAVTKLLLHPVEVNEGLLISSSLDCTVRVTCLDLLQELYKLQMNDPCSGMQLLFSQSKPKLAHLLLQTNCTMQLWKLNHMTKTYLPYRSPVKRLIPYHSLRPERVVILVHSQDGSVRFVDAKTAKLISRIVPQNELEVVHDARLSPIQNAAFVLYETGQVGVMNILEDPAVQVAKWSHTILHKDRVNSLCVTPPNTGIPRFFNTKRGKSDAKPDPLAAAAAAVIRDRRGMPFRKIRKAEFLVGGTDKGSLYFWDTQSDGKVRAVISKAHEHPISTVEYVKNGLEPGKIVSSSTNSEVKIWVTDTLEQVAHFESLSPCPISCISTAPTMPLLFVGFENGESKVFGLDTYEPVPSLSGDHNHTAAITDAVFNETLKILITVGLDGALKVWDSDRNLIKELDIHGEPLKVLALLSDESDLLIGEGEKVVIIKSYTFLPKALETYRHALTMRKRALRSGTKVFAARNQYFLKQASAPARALVKNESERTILAGKPDFGEQKEVAGSDDSEGTPLVPNAASSQPVTVEKDGNDDVVESSFLQEPSLETAEEVDKDWKVAIQSLDMYSKTRIKLAPPPVLSDSVDRGDPKQVNDEGVRTGNTTTSVSDPKPVVKSSCCSHDKDIQSLKVDPTRLHRVLGIRKKEERYQTIQPRRIPPHKIAKALKVRSCAWGLATSFDDEQSITSSTSTSSLQKMEILQMRLEKKSTRPQSPRVVNLKFTGRKLITK